MKETPEIITDLRAKTGEITHTAGKGTETPGRVSSIMQMVAFFQGVDFILYTYYIYRKQSGGFRTYQKDGTD